MSGVAGYTRVADVLRREIEQKLMAIGLQCRVFARGKSLPSLQKKISSSEGKYRVGHKLIKDAIGIRVVLYFPEDIQIVEQLLRKRYVFDEISSTIDKPSNSVFSVSRYNLVFRLPESHYRDVPEASDTEPIDRSFEVQIRSILSEGWHEIEHDLRYKRKGDWADHDDLSRGLNGVVATLETAEWSMRKIFDDLAYKHYKAGKWDAMLHSALRMRITAPLGEPLRQILNSDRAIARSLLRIKRPRLFTALFSLVPNIPLTADNLVFVWNYISIRDKSLERLTPEFVIDSLKALEA